MSEETSVMFEIGVMEHPATKSRIDALTKLVVDSQAKMTVGMDRVGLMAQSAGSAIAPLVAQMEGFKKSALSGYSEMQKAANAIKSEKIVNIVVNGAEKLGDLEAMLAGMKNATVGAGMVPVAAQMNTLKKDANSGDDEQRASINGMKEEKIVNIVVNGAEKLNDLEARLAGMQKAAGGGSKGGGSGSSGGGSKDPMEGMTPGLRNVFKELETDAKGSADAIFQAFDEAKAKLPSSIQANTQLLKTEYRKRVTDQRKAYDEMQDSLRQAVDGQTEATERMSAMAVKGTRSLIGMSKGFAELGLMSAESTEQLAKGFVVIQGLFDIFDGAADVMESFTGAQKGVRQATEAANKVAQIQASMAGPQFAQLRAYQAQLIQETTIANAATAANTRLNASRGVTGAVAVGSAAAAVGSAATSGAPVAAAASSLGSIATSAASGLASLTIAVAPVVSALSVVAGIGAAFGAIAAAGALVVESLNGTASKQGSWTDWLVGSGASFARLVGTTNDTSSMFSRLAKSQIETEKMEKKSAKSRILADHNENVTNLKTAANDETIQVNFKEDARATRSRTENTGSLDAKIAGELKIQTEAMMAMAASQRIVDKARDGEVIDKKTAAKAGTHVSFFQNQIAQSQARQTADQSGFSGTKLSDEKGIGDNALVAYNAQLKIMVGLTKDGNTASDEYTASVSNARKFQASAVESLEKQKSLIKEKLSIEIQGQQKVQDLLKSQLDLKTQALQKSQDEQASAISNFSKLGQIEKQQAIDALAKGRKQGGGSLDDVEKDLLRSVGTKEAVRLANEGDVDEAKKFGFNDKNFDAGFDTEQAGLKAAKTQIEAQLSTSYDVNVKLINDTSGIVASVIGQVGSMLKTQDENVRRDIEQGLKTATALSRQDAELKLRALRQ